MRTSGLALIALCTSMAAVMLSAPAWATKGREAVNMCIDNRAKGLRCEFNVNDKGEIDICNKNGCVYCPSAESECSTARQLPGMIFEPGRRGDVRDVLPPPEWQTKPRKRMQPAQSSQKKPRQ